MRRLLPIATLALLLTTWLPAAAQDRRLARPDATSDRRVALVIGNQAYPTMALKNAAQDARDVHAALREIGFVADLLVDATKRQMDMRIGRFVDMLQPGDVALVYYAGHGVQVAGENYLLPVDVETADEASVRYSSYSASLLHDRIAERGVRLKIMILDACRNNPFRSSRSASQGLAPMTAVGRGTFIAFATGPGGTADDNLPARNGLFTAALLEALREPGLDLDQVFGRVRQRVDAMSNGRQTPWSNSSVVGQFILRAGTIDTRPTDLPPPSAVTTPAVTPGARPDAAGNAPANPAAGTKPSPMEALKAKFAEATTAAQNGRHDDAIAAYKEMIATVPACYECWLNLGIEYAATKRYEDGERAYRKALEIKPDSADAYRGLADIYNSQRRYGEASTAMDEAARLSAATGAPVAWETVFNRGIIAWNAGKIDEALAHFQETVRVNPSYADAHYFLAMAWLNQGQLAKAVASAEEYLKRAPAGTHAKEAAQIVAAVKK